MKLAHQYMHQLDEDIRQAVLGNIGTVISFRIGTEDAKHMTEEMFPEFDVQDFIILSNYKIYLKLFIEGKTSLSYRVYTLSFHKKSTN